jgi:tetratricopeptide (TPR) repeat protein
MNIPGKSDVPSSSNKPSLAILYFKNDTGEESLDYWRRALCVLLISDLSQSRYLSVLTEDRLFHHLRRLELLEAEDYDSEDLIRFAAQAQVDNVVVGSIVKSGEKLRINASIRKIPSGEDIVIQSVDGTEGADIFSMVDMLAKRVKAQLVLPPNLIDADIDEQIETITTRSLEAYKYYIEGRKKYFHLRRGLEAARSLEKAIDIDPEFAMAYRMLSLCYTKLPGYQDKAKDCRKRAFELSQHASNRERFFLQAEYYRYNDRTWNKAIETYQELLRLYPDDYSSIYYLGSTYWRIEDWDRAIETLTKIAHVYYGNFHLNTLRNALCARGDYADALSFAKSLPAELYPVLYPVQLAHDYLFHGKLDLAFREAENMLDRSEGWFPALRLKGDIYLLREDWAQAEEIYERGMDPIVPDIARLYYRNLALNRLASLNLSAGRFETALGYLNQAIDDLSALGERGWMREFHMKMAYINYRKGDITEALRECRTALDIGVGVRGKISILHLQGILFLQMNDMNEVQKAANEVRKEIEAWINPKLMRYYYHLMGHIELKENNAEEAVAYFEKATSFLPFQHEIEGGDEHALFYDSLAFAFYIAGDLEKAREHYENIHSLTTGRLNFGAIYAKSYFMLGKIYEQKRWMGKAIESYEKFLHLWKDADSGIPEIEQASRRLAALKGL